MYIDNLKVILEKHQLWLEGKPGGVRADLSGANLPRVNLSGVDLSKANFYGADLSRADFSWANLSWANLSKADLSGANFSTARLSGANLSGANLSGADLFGSNLYGADLSGTRTAVITNLGGYFVHIDHEYIIIGCQRHLANDWKNFSDEQIANMALNALSYWKKYKKIILSLHKETNK